MYYIRKHKQHKEYLDKTFTEHEEEQYKKGKIFFERGKYVGIMITFVVGAFLFSIINNLLEAKDGAGDTWSCDYCGYSNKFYEMSCRNCGKWR